MKKILLMAAVAMMTAMCAQAQKIEVVDADFGLDEIVVMPKPYIYVEYYFRGFRYIGDSLRALKHR